MHVVAPDAAPLFVTEPAVHAKHASNSDVVEYKPAAQAVHAVAPVALPVFVIEPAWQLSQYDWPECRVVRTEEDNR